LSTEYEAVGPESGFAVGEALQESKRLLRAFSSASAIGFAVLDDELRYQAINNCLASINGLPAKAHLGLTTREIFGEISEKMAEPSYHRVLVHGEISHFEITKAVLPSRADSRYWGLNTNFPIRDRAGTVRQIGIIVIEVTHQRKLDEFLHKLTAQLRHKQTRETFWLAQELHNSVDQYHTALAVKLEAMMRGQENSAELLAQSVEALDQRIMAMTKLMSSVANNFPIDK
jgi:PAS domain S-box-containing protein